MKKYLLIIILILAPALASAQTCQMFGADIPGSCSISFDKSTITAGEGTYLRWQASIYSLPRSWCSANFHMDINNGLGTVKTWSECGLGDTTMVQNGSVWVNPTNTSTYTGVLHDWAQCNYTCSGTLTVTPASPSTPPTSPSSSGNLSCSITFDQNPINRGDQTQIHWSSTGAQLFYINNIGYVGGSGSAILAPGSGNTVSCPTASLVVSNTQCPPGYVLQNDSCVFSGGCPVGYVLQGNQCTFSSCPSGYVKQGNQCVLQGQCGTPPVCQGNNLVNSCTGATIQTCSLGCASGACIAPPALNANLRAAPSLLHVGDTSTISWSSTNAASCSAHGSNGDSWTGVSSSGKMTSPIQGQTIYTLHCIGISGSDPSSIDKTATVNIIPAFIEK